MSKPAASKDKIVNRLTALFRSHGYEGASLSLISNATGLGRSSLYYHFPNGKEDMAEAALAEVADFFREHVVGPLLETGPARDRIVRFTKGLDKFYSGGQVSCLVNVFNLGDSKDKFQPELAKRMRRLIGVLKDTLVQAGLPAATAAARAEDAVISIHGALVVGRALGGTETFRRVLAELPNRLLAPVPGA